MKPPRSGELARVRELAEVAIADTALAVLVAGFATSTPRSTTSVRATLDPSSSRAASTNSRWISAASCAARHATLLADTPSPF